MEHQHPFYTTWNVRINLVKNWFLTILLRTPCNSMVVYQITQCSAVVYRHSLIYSVNVGTNKETTEIENHVNRGFLVVLEGRKIGFNYNRVRSKIAEIKTAEIKECLYIK